MRSGTSMTAGLFAQHGVFFGRTGGPKSRNRKGNFENNWLAERVRARNEPLPDDWPAPWWRQMHREGYSGGPFGYKLVAVHAAKVRPMRPDVVVLVHRDREAILASCRAYGKGDRSAELERQRQIMAAIRGGWNWATVVSVRMEHLVRGWYGGIVPAFDALGVEFDREIADEFIEPSLVHHGEGR
jgi:hypothetical protein